MNRTELITEMSQKTGFTKKDTEETLVAFIDTVMESLAKGESVKLVGFGAFEVSKRAAREGRNPQTNEIIHLPSSKIPKFKPSRSFKDVVNA